MKKMILTAAIALLGAGAFAQTGPAEKNRDMRNLRTDIRDKRQDERQRTEDRHTGNRMGARSETRDIRAENRGIRTERRDARADGVRHPMRRADRQIHRQNMRRHY